MSFWKAPETIASGERERLRSQVTAMYFVTIRLRRSILSAGPFDREQEAAAYLEEFLADPRHAFDVETTEVKALNVPSRSAPTTKLSAESGRS